ncbi:TonB C terminal [Solimonas aquatica]|uniref:TonB C terminal n=1 Tax=Solimonas aquatica TaxID=489703 RepID=A0A1H9GBT1_9GAMM|nr:TonB C-terminal domain-containing protein [Solimonas aquatica]SEQ47537.1 TonB C terminal [Solimonas aquatica]
MTPALVELKVGTAPPGAVAAQPLGPSFLAALLLHALLLGLLLLELDSLLKPGGRPAPASAITVMLLTAPVVAPPSASAEPLPEPQQPVPTPKPGSLAPSKPPRTMAASHPTPAASAAKVASAPTAPPTSTEEPDTELADFLGSLRGRWLEPRGVPSRFHCQVQIRYQAGGMIEAVSVQPGCGSPELVDSIERAVWKSQPLPLRVARNQAGALTVDFSPR